MFTYDDILLISTGMSPYGKGKSNQYAKNHPHHHKGKHPFILLSSYNDELVLHVPIDSEFHVPDEIHVPNDIHVPSKIHLPSEIHLPGEFNAGFGLPKAEDIIAEKEHIFKLNNLYSKELHNLNDNTDPYTDDMSEQVYSSPENDDDVDVIEKFKPSDYYIAKQFHNNKKMSENMNVQIHKPSKNAGADINSESKAILVLKPVSDKSIEKPDYQSLEIADPFHEILKLPNHSKSNLHEIKSRNPLKIQLSNLKDTKDNFEAGKRRNVKGKNIRTRAKRLKNGRRKRILISRKTLND